MCKLAVGSFHGKVKQEFVTVQCDGDAIGDSFYRNLLSKGSCWVDEVERFHLVEHETKQWVLEKYIKGTGITEWGEDKKVERRRWLFKFNSVVEYLHPLPM